MRFRIQKGCPYFWLQTSGPIIGPIIIEFGDKDEAIEGGKVIEGEYKVLEDNKLLPSESKEK